MEKIKELHSKVMGEYLRLHDELADIQDDITTSVKKTQDDNGECILKCVRGNKEVEIKEKTLWYEVMRHGLDVPELFKKYPRIFEELKNKELNKLGEIKKFEIEIFGFTYEKMTLPNIIKLILAVFDWKLSLKENGNENRNKEGKT